MTDADLPILSPAEARVLGCLIEKKELTPDIYPLTLNAAHAAANQKTAREPVMALELAEVARAFGQLEQKGLVRRAFASRVERYEHTVAQRFSLTSSQIAVLGLMLLRGPQTAYELLARAERMARFSSIEALRADLDLLIGRRPPLVVLLERGPGQREERYAHLLSGAVQMPVATAAPQRSPPTSDLEARVEALEEELAQLRARIDALTGEGRS
ncbi:YceH family protein [Mesorhizobium sp. LjNodule214]|uniref:YceH family protein n=1 Tax=Mesorhizobium sp. LjNodule214 TaxID=3342252 RepID=UPI003ED025D5